jgi:hypothetical protein
MRGISISDATETGALSFDLKEILPLLGPDAARSNWRVREVEATGDGASELHRVSDEGATLTLSQLVELAESLLQTIDGEFSAYLPEAETPWLVIRAVDSSAFDVYSNKPDVLNRIRSSFRYVSDVPDET